MKHSYYSQFKTEFGSLISKYPNFVYSRNHNSSLDGIPVFVYHTMEYELFESHLSFLKENEYRTLSITEFYKIITGEVDTTNEKLVLITIDDARSSVWRFAFPLLQKYEMNATVFIIPGLTLHEASVRKNLNNYWSNDCTLIDIDNIDKNDETLCNWEEISEMYNSGFVDIESHTLFHREVFNSYDVIDFVKPDTKFIPYSFIGSPYYSSENIGKPININAFIGLPIFKSTPTMIAKERLSVSDDFKEQCLAFYKEGCGDLEYWQTKIKNLINNNSYREKNLIIKDNSREEVFNDLLTAKKIIQENLDEQSGNHLCLPWTRGNEVTIEVCKDVGIKSVFWGLLSEININKPDSNPYYITRIKNDFLLRLPGKKRKSLLGIYGAKITRRLSGDKIF